MEKITQLLLEQPMLFAFFVLLFLVVIAVLFTSILMFQVVQGLLNSKLREQGLEPKPLFGSLWKSFDKQLTNAIPLEKEQQVMLDHNYDGIKELDNHLPPWWLAMFYASIVFAGVYMLRYHVLMTAPLSEEELQIEIAEANVKIEEYRKTMANSIDESNVVFLSETNDLTAGAEIYKQNCVTCHGAEGQGLVGPNLTDEYWLHGGEVSDVFKLVKYGVPEKGMRAWQEVLSPQQMAQVTSYIITLEGTNPPNPKDPQGEKFVRAKEEVKE